ncbi:MAG: WG repeat-containing protein [Desulfovibrio sp.]|nr:MAG: WG repeat-containing protein [Desulfovibrio sp.]
MGTPAELYPYARAVQVYRRLESVKTLALSLLVILGFAQGLTAGECLYISRLTPENPYLEVSPQGDCGEVRDEDILVMYPEHIDRLHYGENGLGSVYIEGKVFYVLQNGTTARAHYFDNGPDYFVEGLARVISQGKFGFVDVELNVVIQAEYDFASPFCGGVALVRIGDAWGAIDRSGEAVHQVEFTEEEIRTLLDDYHCQHR